MSSTDLKTYNGNCHCGAFKYSISLPEITSATDCSCSMCQRKGYLFVDAKAGPLVIHRGENDGTLQRYTFSTEKWPHDFCKTCGITCIIRELGTEKVFINANTVMGLDVWKLKIEQ